MAWGVQGRLAVPWGASRQSSEAMKVQSRCSGLSACGWGSGVAVAQQTSCVGRLRGPEVQLALLETVSAMSICLSSAAPRGFSASGKVL